MGKIIQNKKGQTTLTIPKALVDSLKLKKGMDYELVVNHHNEVLIQFNREIELEKTINEKEREIPIYFG